MSNTSFRERLFEIIEKSDDSDLFSSIYDFLIIFFIVISLIPLLFKFDSLLFTIFDKSALVVFVIDYILRWATADYKYDKHGVLSFIRYPFSFMALIDLLSILPSLTVLNNAFKVLRVLRMARALRAIRVIRVVKAARYSRSIEILTSVFKESKEPLLAVGTLALAYIFISSLLIFNIEPDTFDSFFDAIYWATVSLTTVGYGDLYPVTTLGRIVAMLSSIFGIAIVALPAGIVTAGYLTAINKKEEKQDSAEE